MNNKNEFFKSRVIITDNEWIKKTGREIDALERVRRNLFIYGDIDKQIEMVKKRAKEQLVSYWMRELINHCFVHFETLIDINFEFSFVETPFESNEFGYVEIKAREVMK